MINAIRNHIPTLFGNGEAITTRLTALYAQREELRLAAGQLIVAPRLPGGDAAVERQAIQSFEKIKTLDEEIAQLRDRRRRITSNVAAE